MNAPPPPPAASVPTARWSALLASPLATAGVSAGLALGFAAATDIRWEDYYITFRSSRNLVEGHGLVFQPGERLHTFTSPLGVLLPALSLWLLSGEEAALALFRVLSAAAFGGALGGLHAIARRSGLAGPALLLLLGAAALDAKSLTFTVGGMETGFMLLFLVLALAEWLRPGGARALPLGVAFAGLLWTRPDGCVYIAAGSLAAWWLRPRASPADTLRQRFAVLVGAGAWGAVLYLPWFLFAWAYYGSPVPHTVAAKAITAGGHSAGGFLAYVLSYPLETLRGATPAGQGWLPHYFGIGGWPFTAAFPARALDLLALAVVFLPFVRWEARVASLMAGILHVYLGYFPIFVFPWYLPPPQWLVVFTLAVGLQQLLNAADRLGATGVDAAALRSLRRCAWVAGLLVVGAVGTTTVAVARQLHHAQRLVEEGVRRPVGEWLRAHAAPGDAVALEPLGYIGYFSGLRTYDFMGLSSREVTDLRRRPDFSPRVVAEQLRPRWFELRGNEAPPAGYRRAAEFDRRSEVRELGIRGQAYLEFDSHFVVYQLDR